MKPRTEKKVQELELEFSSFLPAGILNVVAAGKI